MKLAAVAAAAVTTGCEAPATGVRGAAVTAGAPDPGDPAVVGLVDGLALTCTGTLISDRVIMTAAHCISGGGPTKAVFGPDRAAPDHVIDVVVQRQHPDFDPVTLRTDIGLLRLASSPGVAPQALVAQTLDSRAIGQPLRVIGFGITVSGADDGGTKRTGLATLAEVAASTIDLAASPSQPCDGDSGGPALLTVDGAEVAVGVVSAGDPACTGFARATRVDVYLGTFIVPFLIEGSTGVAVGDRCVVDGNCASGRCQMVVDGFSYCTAACGGDRMCPDAMVCDAAGSCRYVDPVPGATGARCGRDLDCASDRCAVTDPDGSGVCAVRCFVDNRPACPSGSACASDLAHPGTTACVAAVATDGCSAVAGPGAGPIALVAIAAWRRRRRCHHAAA